MQWMYTLKNEHFLGCTTIQIPTIENWTFRILAIQTTEFKIPITAIRQFKLRQLKFWQLEFRQLNIWQLKFGQLKCENWTFKIETMKIYSHVTINNIKRTVFFINVAF